MERINWKELKKEYLQMIDHDDWLVNANFHRGLNGVKEILDRRFDTADYGIKKQDLKALAFIIKNKSNLEIALSV